jgi:hypothetical protein
MNSQDNQKIINSTKPVYIQEEEPIPTRENTASKQFHDDSEIVNEIERTMQKLLNLNILESFSDSNLDERGQNQSNTNIDSPHSSQKSLS